MFYSLSQNTFYTCLPTFQRLETLALHILIRQFGSKRATWYLVPE